tara:strand:- start:115 stop:384 length:270 start_codon:yes stop_codon:yes gene_type:complete
LIRGSGTVRDEAGNTPVKEGDAFIFKPGEAHQIINHSDGDLVFYIVAENPSGSTAIILTATNGSLLSRTSGSLVRNPRITLRVRNNRWR